MAPRAARRRRAGYVLGGLLAVPVLVAGALWLAGRPGPAPAPAAAAASAVVPASGDASAAAVSWWPVPDATPSAPAACAAAVSAACAPSPIHIGLARVPARPGVRRPAAQQSGSAAPTATAVPTATAAPSATASSGAAGTPSGTPADQVLALINRARAAAGLPPLTVTAGLVASANAHDLLMAGGCGLTHQCPGEPAIGDRESAAGVTWTAAGENIGEGGPVAATTAATAQMAVTLTQDMLDEQPPDDGHRLNILSTAFTHIGIVVYRDSAGTVWLTQDFSN